MIQTLRSIFPSCITIGDTTTSIPESEYQWFLTHENDMIGIRHKELTDKDQALLSAFLTPYNAILPVMTKTEQQWKKLFTDGANAVTPPGSGNFRLIYFSYPMNGLNPIDFSDAVKAIFSDPVSIIWENGHSGVIVEEGNEGLSYEQIVDVLMSDLYVKIRFFVGPYLSERRIGRSYYQQLVHDAAIAFSFDKYPVVSYLTTLPAIMMKQIEPDFLRNLPPLILKETADDPDLLATVEAFMQHHLNVSVTAKALFLHRNSLQYRIDKFIEKTGIDIRGFQSAVTVKLALLIKKYVD